jgi:Domain of unknown function (DUF4189)
VSFTKYVILSALLLCGRTVFAEGRCPPGYFPTNNPDYVGCAPSNDASYNSANTSSAPPQPPDPGPRWEFRWGAIAVDGQAGKFAGADGLATPSKAKKAATKLCRKNGGKQCKILVEYHNQCGALVWGDNQYAGFYGALPEEVQQRALASCSNLTANCKIYYLGCSYPIEK